MRSSRVSLSLAIVASLIVFSKISSRPSLDVRLVACQTQLTYGSAKPKPTITPIIKNAGVIKAAFFVSIFAPEDICSDFLVRLAGFADEPAHAKRALAHLLG